MNILHPQTETKEPQNLGSSIGLAALQSPFKGVIMAAKDHGTCWKSHAKHQNSGSRMVWTSAKYARTNLSSSAAVHCWAGIVGPGFIKCTGSHTPHGRPGWSDLDNIWQKKARIGSVKYSKPHLCQCSRQWVLLLTTERKETHLSVPFRTATTVEPEQPQIMATKTARGTRLVLKVLDSTASQASTSGRSPGEQVTQSGQGVLEWPQQHDTWNGDPKNGFTDGFSLDPIQFSVRYSIRIYKINIYLYN